MNKFEKVTKEGAQYFNEELMPQIQKIEQKMNAEGAQISEIGSNLQKNVRNYGAIAIEINELDQSLARPQINISSSPGEAIYLDTKKKVDLLLAESRV